MGREIRRVPANWEHPKDETGEYIPMYDEDYETAARKWLDECIAWDNGTHKEFARRPELKNEYPFFWDYYGGGGPPDVESHRPKYTSDPIWFQIYETVSEGTPVTPPFATKAELVNYLVEYGDFWDQRRGEGGWLRKNAERFVDMGWAPSGWIAVAGPMTINEPRDGVPPKAREEE